LNLFKTHGDFGRSIIRFWPQLLSMFKFSIQPQSASNWNYFVAGTTFYFDYILVW